MSNDAKLGIGLSTGMFFHAPAGTALPEYPLETRDSAWVSVGNVSSDGITLSMSQNVTDFRSWANRIERSVLTEHSEDVSVNIMDTTEESLKTVFGADAVTTTAATSAHGALVSVSLSRNALPDEEAYLFLIKDGDDTIMIGTEYGQITEIADVSFQPGDLIRWNPTIRALGDGWELVSDNGENA